MTTRSWISDAGRSIVLEIDNSHPDGYSGRNTFTIKVIRKPPEQVRTSIGSNKWFFTLEPGFGSFADAAAHAVDRKADSEESALLLSAIAGHMPDFVMRFSCGNVNSRTRLVSVEDVETGSRIWPEESLKR